MKENDFYNKTDMPLGISMALSQNPYLYGMFEQLSSKQREELIMQTDHPHLRRDSEITGDMITGTLKHSLDEDLYK